MRRLMAAGTAALLFAVLSGASFVAQPVASASSDLIEQAGLGRDEAVAFVLAEDARFTDLPGYERQRIEMASQFSFDPVIGASYYRVFPTVTSQWSSAGPDTDSIVFRPRNWVIEVVLVRGCQELVGGETGQLPDPCSWRHAWYYRVHPDGTVTLLFDEGDLEPMPTEPAAG